MDNTQKFVAKISAIWASIGLFLTATGIIGNAGPSWLAAVFSQTFVDALTVFIGSVITFYQFVRVIFAAKPSAEVKVFSTNDKLSYLNPFKV
jgi:hypothetical protein